MVEMLKASSVAQTPFEYASGLNNFVFLQKCCAALVVP